MSAGRPARAALFCLLVAQAAAPAWADAPPAPAGGPAAEGHVDYASDEPPTGRSWQRGAAPRGAHPDDGAARGPEAAQAAIASQESQLVWPLLRMLMVLVGIVLLMLLLARGARSLQARLPGWVGGRQAAASGPRLQVVDRLALGPKHTLAWVERDEDVAFLVAWGEGGTSLLGPLARGSRPSFAATMAEVTHDPKPAPRPADAASPPAGGL